jgi:cytochrome c2
MKPFRFSLILLAAHLAVVCVARAETGNAEEGMAVFKQRCAACHEVEAGVNKVGPDLRGVWGRTSGTFKGFPYSEAMASAGVIWDEANLTQFLLNPKKFVPKNKMAFNGLKRPGELEDILEYLKALKP